MKFPEEKTVITVTEDCNDHTEVQQPAGERAADTIPQGQEPTGATGLTGDRTSGPMARAGMRGANRRMRGRGGRTEIGAPQQEQAARRGRREYYDIFYRQVVKILGKALYLFKQKS